MDRKLKVVVMSCVAIVAAIGAWALPTSAFAAVCPGGPGPTCIELRLNNPPTYGGLWVKSGRDSGAMAGLRWINDLENVAFEAPAGKLFTSVSIELECQGPGTRLHDVQVYYYLAPGQLCEQQLIEPPLYAAKPHGAPGVNSYILDTVPSDVLCAAGFRRIEIEPQIGSACNIVTTAAFQTASSALADSASTWPNMTEAPRENTPIFSDGATVQTWPTPGVPGCLADVTPNWPGALINVDSTAPVAPPIQLCFNNLVQPTCFATPDNGATVFSSADAHAVQQAVDAASSGGTVKIAGTCPGVESRAGTSQSAHISKTLTLLGGFTSTAWTTTYPLTQPTILDAGGAGRVLYATQNLTVANLTAQNGSVAGFGGGIMADSALLLQNVSVYSSTAMIADGGGVFATGNGSVFGGVFRANKCTSGCSGGGISSGGALIVSGTSFISNTGGHNGGGLHNNYALTLTNSSFSNNLAANGDGGGVANFGPIPIVISGSTFAANRATNTGGGAYFVGSVNVSASAFSSNTASSGGGAYFVGNVNVSNSAFSSNTASSAGGGALFNGSVTLSNSAFNSNTASSAGGGALFNGNAPTVVTGASFVGNVAPSGGGAYFLWAATVTDSLFMSNTAISGGGAWFDDNNNITASSFLGNKASDGGGAYFNFNQPKRLVNNLFARNSASNRGAAIFVADATPLSLIHTTIASPTLALGAAVYVNGGTVLLTDTLISNHTVGILRTGGAVSEDYTLFAGVTTPRSGIVSAGAHSITGTAAFVNPAADDYRLWPDSAAINAGGDAGVATDFFGEPRPQGGAPDIGYDETPYFVSCFATHNNGTTVFSSTNASAVRLALIAATPGGVVKAAGYCPGVASQDGSDQTALITQTLTLAGGYTPTNWTTAFPITQPTTLDALSAGRVLVVTAAASLQGFSVTRGKIDGAGGGIAAMAAVTLTQLTVNSNTASQGGGGAYFVWPATVTGTLFMSNTATYGGGAWFDDNNTVTASSFLGNRASDGGGAYFNFIQPKRLVNTLFARNSASNRGAAIFVADATPLSLIHTTIASPTLALGAAVYVNGGTVLLTDTLISSHTVGIQRAGGAVSEDYTLFAGVTTPYTGTVSAGGHAITGTAAFVNPAADNYRLGPGSAAINAGVNTGVAVDFEGQPRPIGAGYDIGYDEHIPPRAWLPVARR